MGSPTPPRITVNRITTSRLNPMQRNVCVPSQAMASVQLSPCRPRNQSLGWYLILRVLGSKSQAVTFSWLCKHHRTVDKKNMPATCECGWILIGTLHQAKTHSLSVGHKSKNKDNSELTRLNSVWVLSLSFLWCIDALHFEYHVQSLLKRHFSSVFYLSAENKKFKI